MPPPSLIDLDSLDLQRVVTTRDEIYTRLPHRHEFQLLDGLVFRNNEAASAVAFVDIQDDGFWVRGHLPDRPLFPGVLMIEAAGQLAAYMAGEVKGYAGKFIGLGGVERAKFRDTVVPNCRMYIAMVPTEIRARRIICACQGMVNGRMVFEAEICGMAF